MSISPTHSKNSVWGAMQKKNNLLGGHTIKVAYEGEASLMKDDEELSGHSRDSNQPDFELGTLTRLEQLEVRFDPESKINLQSDSSGRERYFLRVGYLQKFTRSKAQRFVFILLSNSLIWCSENTKGILSKQGEMVLRNQKCSKTRERDFFIEGAHSFTCTASSKAERDEWVASINSVLYSKHPLITPRDTIAFQGSVTKIRKKSAKQTSQYMMLYLDGNLAWGSERATIGKEAKVVDLVQFDRFLSGETSGVPEKAQNRFLAIFTSRKTAPSLVIFATRQQRDVWISWWGAKQRATQANRFSMDPDPPSASASPSSSSSPLSSSIVDQDDSSATTRIFKLLMAGECNGIGSSGLQIIREGGGAVEIGLLLPVLTCLLAATPFWIRAQCAPIVAAIKERAIYDLEVAQAVYACYHCGFLEAHPHNSLAYASWCVDVPRRGDICTALKHMYQRPVGFEFLLESMMEAYHPFRGNRIRRIVLEKILDESSSSVSSDANNLLSTKGLIAIYCYRDETEVKKRERHERKASRIFAQGGRALSPDILLPDSPIQDGFRTVSVILKIGSHLRREVAYMHIAKMMNLLLEQENMVLDGQPIQIHAFGAVAFTTHLGVLQFMPEMVCMRDVRSGFLKEPSQWRTELELNLMCTAIGTYLASTILSLSERTDTNILLQPDGTVMVGELGPRLLDSPETCESIGLTQDFKAVLGDANWDVFVDMLIDSFVALRKHIGPLVQFCTMLLNSVTPSNQVAESLQSGFMMEQDIGAACAVLRKRAERLLISKPTVKKEQNFSSGTSPLVVVSTPAVEMVHGNTALIVASEQGQLETVEALLSKKADPNQANEIGRTPLMVASEFGREKVVRLLLQKKADVNQLNKDSGNALILASQAAQWEIVQLLLEVKADPKHCDKWDENSMYWANSFGESHIVALLENLGVKPV